MNYFLGVDIGGTKSHAVICDQAGVVYGVGVGGTGNHESVGKRGFQKTLSQIVIQALTASRLATHNIVGMGFGVAGYDWAEDRPMMDDVIASLGIQAPYQVMNDAGPALLAGSRQGWGVSVVAGTGVNARGRGPAGQTARVTGNGLLFDEVGGGSELAYRAVGQIARAWSGRGPQTALTNAFVQHFGATSVEDMLAGIARGRYAIGSEAALLVFEAAAAGDAVAQRAIVWLGQGLGDLANGIIRQLEIAKADFDIVLSGSIFNAGEPLVAPMRQTVHGLAPTASFVRLLAPPVAGCVMLAMETAVFPFLPVQNTIKSQVQAALTKSS